MTATSKTREPGSGKANLRSNLEERIRRRAYELLEQRGRVEGLALQDRLRAEGEILRAQKLRKAKAARGSQC